MSLFLSNVANKRKSWIGSVMGGALLILVSSFVFYLLWRKRRIAGKFPVWNLNNSLGLSFIVYLLI